MTDRGSEGGAVVLSRLSGSDATHPKYIDLVNCCSFLIWCFLPDARPLEPDDDPYFADRGDSVAHFLSVHATLVGRWLLILEKLIDNI